jgi:B-box zinc finger
MAAVEHDAAPRCANHPSVETRVSCANCGKPICPDCMVQSPVGIKCADCARTPRSARVRLRPDRAARATAAAIAIIVVGGVALASLAATPFGFFGFLVAYGVGRGGGELVLRAAGRFRGQTTGAIAALGAFGAYLAPFALVPLLYGDRFSQRFGVIEVVLGAVAGYFAYRQAS